MITSWLVSTIFIDEFLGVVTRTTANRSEQVCLDPSQRVKNRTNKPTIK